MTMSSIYTFYWTFEEVMKANGYQTITALNSAVFDNDMKTFELLTRFFYRSKDCYFMYNSSDDSEDLEYCSRFVLFCEKIRETKDEYEELIKIQTDNKTRVLNGIKQVSTTKFNDTPQGSGDFSGDTHTTTFTKNETETTLDLADQLALAEKALADIYDKWLKELKGWLIYA